MASAKKDGDRDVAPYALVAAREPEDIPAIVEDHPPDEPENDEPLSRFQLKERLLRDRKKRR